MSIRKIIGMQNGVSDYTLYVVPRWISLPKNSKSFILYLQKGMQVIGKFQRDESMTIKDSVYRFHHAMPAEFKVSNVTNSTYNWILYSIDPISFQQVFEDSASFNLQRTIKLYQAQLSQKERQIQTSVKIKTIDRQTILQFWKNAKSQMKTHKSTQKCVFSSEGHQIKFQIQIKNQLDSELQKLERQREKDQSRLRRSRSHHSSNSSDSGKKPKNPSIKEKAKPIEVSYPQLHYHYNYEDSAKDKIQMQSTRSQNTEPVQIANDANIDEQSSNTMLRIVNPKGQEISPAQPEQRIQRMQTDSSNSSSFNQFARNKKFSLLSDIIELSHEGSSTYNYPDFRSSGGFKNQPLAANINYTQKEISELNKFKTLAYQSHPTNRIKDQFRRPKTAQVKSMNSSQVQTQSLISFANNAKPKGKGTSGDPNGKWIIIIAIIIILFTVMGIKTGDGHKKSQKSSRSKAH